MTPRITRTQIVALAAIAVLAAGLGVLRLNRGPESVPVPKGAHAGQLDMKTCDYKGLAADCGTEVNLYLRAKIGFCNCTTGVSDDNELDRLSDFSLMGEKRSVLGPGHPIRVGWMNGRSRSYTVADPYRAPKSVLAVAFNDHCDAVVATIVVAHDRPAAIEPSVIEFLNSQTLIHWAEVTLGL